MTSEDKQLRAAQRNMDRLYQDAKLLPEVSEKEDDWNPSPPRFLPDYDWTQTLDRIEKLHQHVPPAVREQFRQVAGTSFGQSHLFLQDIGDYEPQFAGWLVGKAEADCWTRDLYVHRSGKLGTVTCCTATEYELYPVTLEDFAQAHVSKANSSLLGVKPLLIVHQFDADWALLAEKIIEVESGP